MLAALSVEIRKLNRSLAAVLALVAPGLIAFLLFSMALSRRGPQPWEMWARASLSVWAFFMLPMAITALTALVAHMEHAPRAWDHLRALPVARWRIYGAKALCVLAIVAVMSLLNPLMALTAVRAAAALKPNLAPLGTLDLGAVLLLSGKVAAASTLLLAIQLWMALRFASFVPALALGIGGTFFAVVATSAKKGLYFPWQMPVNVLAQASDRAETALALGGGLGAVVLVVAVIHLAWREVL